MKTISLFYRKFHLQKNGIQTSKDLDHLALTKICGVNSNLDSVYHFLQPFRPCIIFLTETQISSMSSTNHLVCPGFDVTKVSHDKQYIDLFRSVTHSWGTFFEFHGESQVNSLVISKAFTNFLAT